MVVSLNNFPISSISEQSVGVNLTDVEFEHSNDDYSFTLLRNLPSILTVDCDFYAYFKPIKSFPNLKFGLNGTFSL